MKKIKRQNRIVMLYILIGYLVIAIMFIGVFMHKISLLNKLEEETYNKISSCIIENGQTNKYLDEEIEKILDEHQNKEQEIKKETIINSITGTFITATIILTSINKIIKNTKRIWTELNGSDQMNDYVIEEENKENIKENYNYHQIEEMIKKICGEKEELAEKILTLLLKQFTQVLDQTIYFTNQINHDRDLLATGIQEIKDAIEQIGQVIIEKQNDSRDDEEISVAVEQINIAAEEMRALLVEMEKKIHHLSNSVDQYHTHKQK